MTVASSSRTTEREVKFDWPVCHPAENVVLERIDSLLERNSFARAMADRMRDDTGTLPIDWTDHLVVPFFEENAWRELGFVVDVLGETPNLQIAFQHPEAMLPRVLLDASARAGQITLALKADSLADFTLSHGLSGEPEGEPFSRFRRLLVAEENGARLIAIERRGYRGYLPVAPALGAVETLLKARELWLTRRRIFDDDTDGFRQSLGLLERIVSQLGRDLACHVVFEGERIYWERRNRAAQFQKHRQDQLGLGWANHDHHTFRSSRKHFLDLMRAMEMLGFERRERYYAGAQAGWGAQILEQPVEGIVVFADVDLMPDEVEIDFSRIPLPPAPQLGTVGLWVGLHGESFVAAGMHHLEARFDFDLVRSQLASLGINGMPPFSDFEFLKQAFTEGERWPVRPERAQALYGAGYITDAQCRQFIGQGAIGSHLETLQRRGGFKGFNQKSVSAIIQATDPRKQPAPGA